VRAVRATNPSASDEDVIEIAQTEGRALVTADEDFGELVYSRASIVWGAFGERFPSRSQAKLHAVVEAVSCVREELVDKSIVVESGRVRSARPTIRAASSGARMKWMSSGDDGLGALDF
jgi:predicted nuclease of predicted toxin-antitoxin system